MHKRDNSWLRSKADAISVLKNYDIVFVIISPVIPQGKFLLCQRLC